ncbi:MAG: molybdate ABC transporter permease subunit [Phycisphaerales bacterium]|nr:molybdate ABC transporter permease subunit [Phycisphaerales bacterium]
MWTDLGQPLTLSLQVALAATACCVLVGTPLAWLLARRRGTAVAVVEAAVILPLALPPTVIGYGLLLALGRSGLGSVLEEIGFPFLFSLRGAVAASTVIALPLFVLPARAAIEGVDRLAEDAARLDGAGPLTTLVRVTLPLAWRGLLAAMVLAFARSLGEFGATLMVAGRIPGRTETLPLAIYGAVESGRREEALGPVLVLAAIALMAAVVQRGWLRHRG